MKQVLGAVVFNTEVKPGYFLMEIKAPAVARQARPGQFLTVRCGEVSSPLLRRPLGFHRINGPAFRVLYEVVGKGTRFLSKLKPADKADVLGPLGNGFTIPDKPKDIVIVAGGIGVAPLFALAEKAVDSPQSIVHRKPLVLLGARTKDDILCEREFRKLGCEVKISTDDGSQGHKGHVTDLLEDRLSSLVSRPSSIYACGPEAMLKEVSAIARRRGAEAYASLEENIACGVGACLGCAIETRSGYKLVCEDGPVFDLNEVVWR
jgi:dihydroorotate dehydrogenase electron transfer subunit